MSKIRRLPDSELDIMLVLWEGHPDMSRVDIETVINGSPERQLAPTTINSLLARLERKGFVAVKKAGRNNLYTPRISREDYCQQESRTVLERLYASSLENFVTSLYNGRTIGRKELERLDKFLEELGKEEPNE